MDFGSKMGPFLAPSRASKTGVPSTYFDIASKKRPRPLQECPRAPQERPKSVPRVPKSVLRPSKSVQNVPRGRPRCPQRVLFVHFCIFFCFCVLFCAFLVFSALFCVFQRFSACFCAFVGFSAFFCVFWASLAILLYLKLFWITLGCSGLLCAILSYSRARYTLGGTDFELKP